MRGLWQRIVSLASVFALLWFLSGCKNEIRDTRQVGLPLVDDARTLPGWLQPGNLAVLDLCRPQPFTEDEVREQMLEIKYAGFTTLLFVGSFATGPGADTIPWSMRAVRTNSVLASPFETEAKWTRLCAFAHEIGLRVLLDLQPETHALTHEHYVVHPERFMPHDTSAAFQGPVLLRAKETALRDSIEQQAAALAERIGSDGFLLYAPHLFSEAFSRSLKQKGKVTLGFDQPSIGSRLFLSTNSKESRVLNQLDAETVVVWLCGLPQETVAITAERMLLPGVAAALWVPGASADRLSFLASLNRLKRDVQALNTGRMGGRLLKVETDKDSCITAFKRTAGETGVVFLRNRCDFTVDFTILSSLGGMYHNTLDYRLLSDFSPNRVVLPGERYTIFVRKTEATAP